MPILPAVPWSVPQAAPFVSYGSIVDVSFLYATHGRVLRSCARNGEDRNAEHSHGGSFRPRGSLHVTLQSLAVVGKVLEWRRGHSQPAATKVRLRQKKRGRTQAGWSTLIDTLEDRLLLSATASPTFVLSGHWSASNLSPSVSPATVAPIAPAQMRAAYGVNSIILRNGTAGTGAGQTIAIVDAYNDPNIISDANTFNTQFGLQQFNVSGGPTLQVLNESGGTSLPSNSSTGGWDIEESLDVEWAHSIAPQANIILFEANSASYFDLLSAVYTAADYAGVSAVSMSWGGGEYSGETSSDGIFSRRRGTKG